MLKKTKIITNAYWIVDSTYTVSYPDRCTSWNLSTDHPSRATLDNRKGGGGICQEQEYHSYVLYIDPLEIYYIIVPWGS